MELQHLDLKLPLESPAAPDLGAFIPVFHGWVREQADEGLLIDVADYRHVINGPGVVLVGHDANYSLDLTDSRPGLRYVRKTPVPGGPEAVLRQGLDALDRARVRLEQDTAFSAPLRFSTRALELRINDRLLAPNRADTFSAVHSILHPFFTSSGSKARIEFLDDPRRTFGAAIHTERALWS